MLPLDSFATALPLFDALGAVAQSLSADRDEADNLAGCLKTLAASAGASQAIGLLQGFGGLSSVAEYGEFDEAARLAFFTLARLSLETSQAVVERHGESCELFCNCS